MAQSIIGENIVKALGRGFPSSSIISSASLVTMCLFYVYSAATYAQVVVYPLIDRVTYYTLFGVYITFEYIDHMILGSLLIVWLAASSQKSKLYYVAIGIFYLTFVIGAVANYTLLLNGIALACLPAIVALLLYDKYSDRKILKSQSQELTLNYFGILGIVIGIIGLVFAITSIVSPNALPAQPVRNYAYDVFVVLSSFSPALVLLLIACLPVKLITDFTLRALKIKQAPATTTNIKMRRRSKTVYLSLIMLLSIVFVIIPHTSNVNLDNQPVGVDTRYYVNWVTNLASSQNLLEFVHHAFVQQNGGDRPISLIFLYALQKFTAAPLFYVIEYSPVVLGPALILAVYFLTRELVENDIAAILAAFLTAVSFHTLIGIYAGFYANWLALVFGYLSFFFLFKFLKNGGNRNLALYGGLLLMTLFTHVYTWSILVMVAGVFLSVTILRKNRQYINGKKNAGLLLVILLATLAIDIGRAELTGSSGGIERDLQIAGNLTGPEQFALRWNNLTYTTIVNVGGLFANFIILGLGLYWIVFKSRIGTTSGLFLFTFLSIGILPFLFGEWTIQTRTFYDIPFQIPAALALIQTGGRQNFMLRSLPIYLWLIAMPMIALSNFYLVEPLLAS